MKLSDLEIKDVIREEDGTRLGKVTDITIDAASGKVISIHVSKGLRFSGLFSSNDEILVPWNKIVKIGSDVIIVETVHNIKMELNNNEIGGVKI